MRRYVTSTGVVSRETPIHTILLLSTTYRCRIIGTMALGPLPDVANVARVKLNGTYQTRPWVALFFWHYNALQVTSAGLNTLCAGFATAWDTHLKAAFHATVSLVNVEAYDLARRDGAQSSSAAGVAGTRVGTALPVSVAAVVSWDVNYRWRGGHPRTYWPAGVMSDITSGHLWTSGALAAFEAGNDAFLTAINGIIVDGQGGYLTCVRYVHTPVKGEPPVYFDPPLDLRIVANAVDARLDTQRRRLGPDL